MYTMDAYRLLSDCRMVVARLQHAQNGEGGRAMLLLSSMYTTEA